MKPAHSLLAPTVVGIAVVLGVTWGASAAQTGRASENISVLRAQKIELVDTHGVTRARLSTEPGGEVVLRLMGANGELRVKLGASNDGSGLLLANAATEPGVHLLAQRTEATLRLKEGEREKLLEP